MSPVELASTPLAGEAPYSLEVTAFDDVLRARVGDTAVEADRGDLRDGRLALATDGRGEFRSLHVDAIEAFVSQVETSRYPGFPRAPAELGRTHPRPPRRCGAGAGAAHGHGWRGHERDGARRLPAQATALRPVDLRAGAAARAGRSTASACPAAGDSAGTRLVLLESPEPLAFSTDVHLTVTHRVVSLPGGSHPTVPRSWLAFAAGLVFARTTVRGDVPEDIVASVRQAVRLVRAVRGDRLGTRIRYEVYAVEVDVTARGARLQGELEDVRPASPLTPTRLRPRVMGVGTVALLDRFGQLVGEVLPLPVEQDETVALTVIANGAEDKALLVPATPMRPDDYRFAFEVDRVRYRSAVVDDTTNYRASASWTVRL